MEKTRKFQVFNAGLTNLFQYFTTDLARGIMTNERKHSALSKARFFKHSENTSTISFFVFNLLPTSSSLFHMRGVDFTHFNTCCYIRTHTPSHPHTPTYTPLHTYTHRLSLVLYVYNVELLPYTADLAGALCFSYPCFS